MKTGTDFCNSLCSLFSFFLYLKHLIRPRKPHHLSLFFLEIMLVRQSENCAIDLLLTDVRMGEMSGVDLAEKVRARQREMKLLFISAQVNKEDLKNAPVAPFIRKPISATKLARQVRTTLDQ